MKVGVFDSGIGGLSVLHLALKYLPNEQFIYYADETHVPYGEKTKQQVIEYTDHAVQFMLEQNVQAIVIACNTATSAAINVIREKYSIPIIGMEPAVKKALDTNSDKRVLVAATPITVKGEKMKALIGRVDNEHLVDLIPLPQLVRFAEKGEFESVEIIEYLKKEFKSFSLENYSQIVLGCTHFNYFKDSFKKVLPDNITFVDGNEGTIHRLIQELGQVNNNQSLPFAIDYYYSDVKVTDQTELLRLNKYLARLDEMLLIR